MTAALSRHDHFPRADAQRRLAMRQAVQSLDAVWAAADIAPGGLLAAIDAVADLAPDVAIERLLPWLTDPQWLRERLDAALALLAADPFARPPLRPVGGGDGGPGGLVLADRGAIRLTLQLWPFATHKAAAGPATFVPGRAALHILASGGAQLCQHHVVVTRAEDTGGFTASAAAPCHSTPPRPLRAGETLRLDTARQSFTLVPGQGDMLLLELTVQPPSPLPIRTYDTASGRLLHVSASRRDSSFRAMALTLLRHLGRTDAAPLFVAETHSEDFAARWHAMRELVALDPAAAWAPLAQMAATDPHPEVRRAAAATGAMLSPPLVTEGPEGGGSEEPCTRSPPSTPNAAATRLSCPPAGGRASETCELVR
ncbi:HEAT repeat domain-containing protein [Sphingopyxis sp.]|uniref:HEAT repeat domain-containing protein n=1 Tax=Sphingopyxis sp. TaxID=1908224 RepID=UPI003D14026E